MILELAQKIERLLIDADYNTANAALKIAMVLIDGREIGALEFQCAAQEQQQ